MIGARGSANRVAMRASLSRWLPLGTLLLLTLLFFALGGGERLGMERIDDNLAQVRTLVEAHWVIALFLYFLLYLAAIALLVVPPSLFLSLTGGVLFGTVAGGLVCVIAKTLGGYVSFRMCRSSFRDGVERLGPRARAFADRLADRGLWLLAAFRLAPIFPFGTVTIGAAAARMSRRDFLVGTVIGQIPSSFIYAHLGWSASRAVLRDEAGAARALGDWLASADFLLPSLFLIALSGVALLVDHVARRRGAARD
ncbi:TVP38/TMEM64 family protein [Sphingomicrobium arenosum]|uniref:TVP38/TMEM64 family protein n=1 Tax=Sphingomicrobium arenosum TaxID=2233861 RepID=UPI002240F8E8|nr:VTT domain-containing protein [Sphingomicrobium arenosum]